MKINGVEITGSLAEPNQDVFILPRGKAQIVFEGRAIVDLSEFEEKVPVPVPPRNFHKGKDWINDLDDPTYTKAMEQYTQVKTAYYVVGTLQGMEWDKVDFNKPSTWIHWEEDFKANGFTQHECNLILRFCFEVNNLDEVKLQQAHSLFVLGREEAAKATSSQNTDPKSLSSGKPVKDLV